MAPDTSGGHTSLLADPELLSKIDQLRENNVGQHVPLPQLVVVGDQSSGKSSLLENLTGIPFPRNLELCTRYATQITSCRDHEAKVQVTVIPGPEASDQHKERLKEYQPRGMSPDDFRAEFPRILEEVNRVMGIRRDATATDGTVFSEDVLKVEISGPDEDYLTLIDVPGIFRAPTEGLTAKKDVDLVRRMVHRYIKDSRTVILAVLPSNVDPATQEILTMAEEYDKEGERTIGVLTKPDLVKEDSAKRAVCNIVQGKKRPLALGYYVARNRGPDENDAFDKDAAEALFSEEPWNSLPKDRVGIRALRTRLSQLLGQITQQEFPGMRKEIERNLAQCLHRLESLGPPRQNENEQRAFLLSLSRQFHDLVQNALETRYNRHAAFVKKELRLTTTVANFTDTFKREFSAKSHFYYFDDENPVHESVIKKERELESGTETDDTAQPPQDGGWHSATAKSLWQDGIISEKFRVEYPEIGIMEWLQEVHLQSRGLGLGTFNNAFFSNVFRAQSVKWIDLTMVYLSKIIVAIHDFITASIYALCTNANVCRNLLSSIAGEVRNRYKAAMEHATFLVSIERDQTPFTLNDYFTENLQKSRGNRIATELVEKVRYEPIQERNVVRTGNTPIVSLEDVRTVTRNKSSVQQAIEDVHDSLCAFYKIARERFVDTVYQQVVQGFLLTGSKSPLSVFDQEWVLSLGTTELELIAGESLTVKEQRATLQKKIKELEVAIQILK